MFSRRATGLIPTAATGVGRSDLAAGGLAGGAAELPAAPADTLVPGASAVRAAAVVPGTCFDPDVGPEAGFAVAVPAGLALALGAAAAPTVELGTEADAGFGALVPGADAAFGAGLSPGIAFGVVFAVEAFAGLAVPLGTTAVPVVELGADGDDGLDVGAAGLTAEVVGDGFGVCALGAAVPAAAACLAGAAFAAAAGLAGAG